MAGCIDRGLDEVEAEQETIRGYVKDIEAVAATLDPAAGSCAERRRTFEELIDRFEQGADAIRQKMAGVMISFLAGLFVGEGKFEEIRDDLDLERWFRVPKSHERRIHGHRHAGVRIVQEGPTLVHALDAHVGAPGAVHRGRSAAVSDGPRAAEPETGDGPTEDHEEGAIHEETAVTPGRLGAALSGIAGVLAPKQA